MAGRATTSEPEGPPRKEVVFAVTDANALIKFNAGQPQRVQSNVAVKGMQTGETILGIDYRVARGVLFALGSSGRIYTLNTATAVATAVGTAPLAAPLSGTEFGFDFNPAVDRIRIVGDSGQNMRAHPDTGAVVDSDPQTSGIQIDGQLAYATGDANAGKTPRVSAAAYTYNKTNDKITTNFAIDGTLGVLATQGTRENRQPSVSPNTGQLYTVGSLGIGAVERVSFDIADINNAAFIAVSSGALAASKFYLVNLDTGAATFIGTIGGGLRVRGIAIEP
ncbi:MAG TPA: DUF4394 domain-containing protein [Burkholderiales bacterium]|nr:DUF4394 domain-containing protein [Burkholderiales bacterium]